MKVWKGSSGCRTVSLLVACLTVGAGCSSSSPVTTPRQVDSLYDLNAALSGHPTERTIAVASALQSQLTAVELETLLTVDWGQSGASRLFSSGRLTRAVVVAANVLVSQPDPPLIASALAVPKARSPMGCDPDCDDCKARWNKRLKDFGTQTNSSAWTCGFFAVAGLATGGVTIPGALVTCAALVSMLYVEFNAYRNELLASCAAQKPGLVNKGRASANDLQSFLESCRIRNDGGAPDGGAPDGGAPDGGVPDGGVPDGGVPDGCPMSCPEGTFCPLRCDWGIAGFGVGAPPACVPNGSFCCPGNSKLWCQQWQGSCVDNGEGNGGLCCGSGRPGSPCSPP